MRADTQIFIATRNIGDASDNGTVKKLSVKEAIFWLATELGRITMARRIVIGIGRNQNDALLGISAPGDARRQTNQKLADSLNDLLASVEFEGDESDSPELALPASADPLDDWKA